MFKEVDHIAIVVRDTEEALNFYRDVLKLPLLFSEELTEIGVRLTHLDMGNLRLQLVQPLDKGHPLNDHLEKFGEGFHHVAWKVDDTEASMNNLNNFNLKPKPNEPHPAPNNGTAAFIDPKDTRGLLWELTSTK